ncbi:MAG: hypothetical protein CV089_10710 [Nitrospira sp. WS110]|nr:hypothetical protein [Nitrospira sp. WS110]
MLKYTSLGGLLFILVILTGCSVFSKVDASTRVHDIYINGQNSITPLELYAAVGEEIRWHNQLAVPIHLGLLGVKPIEEVRCGKGFKTWFGTIRDIIPIPAGDFVSVCFLQVRPIRYNIWTDITDPFHSMSPTAIIHLDEAG